MAKKVFLLYRDLIVLTLIAVPIGIAAGFVDTVFGRILLWLTDIRTQHVSWFLPFLGIIGVFILWLYKKIGGKSIKGMALIFETGHGINPDIPLRLIPFSIVSTWLTHLFGGSAGREGVAIQIGGTIAHWIGRRLPIKEAGKILLIAGMAAGFGGLFRTPIAAALFALEVLTVGVLEEKAILPALTASFTASYVSGLLGLEKFTFLLKDQIQVSWELIPKLLIAGVLFGLVGSVFTLCLHKSKETLLSWIKQPLLRIFIMGTGISILSFLCFKGRYSGLGTNLISMSFSQGIYSWDFACKLLFTVLTLSAGFQGGEVTPLFSIGASLGVVLASFLGLSPVFLAALGYVAVFGSATNTLLAPMIMGAEIFGAEYLPYFAVVCGLAYSCNLNLSIYPLQKRKE
ncbi:chloride channel protein [Lacrimispora algidixylanolytica]|uniref:Voltage-gated chloride channel protein n=1 Tax=Lacrimispora algidixylanolytica TaxID=94868 RepID=A0A419T025_9FIRM|nr:chloride channel protein [Lacrimispora algidixylanolytica]RKD30793.1 voltage-gated chloride channel protein [Lacrimispora algidixylanolytica]